VRAVVILFVLGSLLSSLSLTQSVIYDIPDRWPRLGQPLVGYIRHGTEHLARLLGLASGTFAYWQGVLTVVAFSVACLSLYGLVRSSRVPHAAAITALFASELVSVHQFGLYFLTYDIQRHVANLLPSVSNMDVLFSSASVFVATLIILVEEVWHG